MGSNKIRAKSPAIPTPTPRANSMEGQLRIAFRQVSRNGCMGLEQAAFVSAHFGIDTATMRRLFKEIGGAALDEDTFLSLVQKAISQSRGVVADAKWMASASPALLSRNEAILHKQLSALPNMPPPAPPPPPPPPLPQGAGSPIPVYKKADVADAKRDEAGTRRPGTSMSRRSASAPPGGEEETQRPGTASYMAPYTPQKDQLNDASVPWKWSRIDNNVPKNIRTVLLKPMRPASRAATPKVEDLRTSSFMEEIRTKLRGITRIDAILTIEEVLADKRKLGVAPAATVRNGMQILGVNAEVEQIVALAREVDAYSEEDEGIKYKILFNALIPMTEVLTCEDAGIQPEKFAKFKQQRMRITSSLSSKEIKLLELLRSKLRNTGSGASDVRKAFKHVDTKGTGRVNPKGMQQALALRGIGMAQADAEVLYAILDPEGKEGMIYNEFTALMFPPNVEEAYKDTVYVPKEFRESISRTKMREKCHQTTLREEKPLSPGEVLKFLKSLNSDQILQILRNKVALAMKAGPGALRRWFQVFDQDGDNKIDKDELKDTLVDFGLYLSDAQVQALMAKVDHDLSGNVDQNEFVHALLPSKHYSLSANESELKDRDAVGVSEARLTGDDLKSFLKDKLLREFVKKGETSPGYQIREALSRFDANRDGSMSTYELRKAFHALGLSVPDDTIRTLIQCYDKDGNGSADLIKFVEDIDPTAFSYAFSVGNVAKAGSFDTVEKEAKLEATDSDQVIIRRLRETLRKRMKRDGTNSVLKEIRSYSTPEGKMSMQEFSAALVRLGLKIIHPDNLRRTYSAFCNKAGEPLDMYHFAAQVEDNAKGQREETDQGRPPLSTTVQQRRSSMADKIKSDTAIRPATASVVALRPFG